MQAVTLSPGTWRTQTTIAATLDAPQNATLAPATAGLVTQVLFTSGQQVQAGQVLVQLENGPQQAQLTLDQTKLAQAQKDEARAEKLMAINGTSQSALETAQAATAEAQAQVALDQATLATLQITAPFAGTIGIRKLSAGDYVQAGQAITTLTANGPLNVFFAAPQSEAAGITLGESFTVTVPYGTQNITGTGSITALSPTLNPATNAQDAEGQLTPHTGFAPGMAGIVTIATGAAAPAFIVPSTALTDSTLGPFIFVLTPAGTAYTLTAVYVTELGDSGPNTYIGTNGLQAGEKILALGGFKLTAGTSVSIATP